MLSAAAPPHYLFLSISLNSLDREGVRLLSPRDSQITSKTRCRCRWCQCRRCYPTPVRVRWRPWSLLCFVSCWSVVEPSWDDQGSSIWGGLSLFWFRSRPWLYSGWCMFNLYLCEVAIVSQLFIPFLFSTWDCVNITPLATCLPCGYPSKSCPDTWEI